MKKILFFLFLSISFCAMVAQSTGPTKKCPTCGKPIAKCEYRGKHPKPTKPARPVNGFENGHEWVDLGLPSGTKWATMNVGANSPEESGDYFAWGETKPKSTYDSSNYKWCERGVLYSLTKYCTKSNCGIVDNKTELELCDDAARANWEGEWRMPTLAQTKELKEKCTWTWTQMGGHNGYKVVGPNGYYIFLPAAGKHWSHGLSSVDSSGHYWSSSLDTSSESVWAKSIYFFSDLADWDREYYRDSGHSIRPVLAP